MDTSGGRRLCLFCEKWASGGIESFLFNLLTHMELDGLEVDLVTAQLCQSVFAQPLQGLGVRFVELAGDPRRLKENSRQFRALLRRRRYDVVHLNLFQGLSLSYAKLAADAGVPIRIAHSHNAALRKSPGRPLKLALHRWGRKRFAGYATHLWACSAPAARFLFGQDTPYTFIPNGVDTGRFRFDLQARAQVRQELGCGDKLVVGNVGRLCEQKNQDFLLDVFQEVRLRRGDSVLLLVGEGEARSKLEEKARALGLEDRVIFYGATDKVERLLWAMDVLAMPSRFEGLPVTGVEAQAAGLPCLFSDRITQECGLSAQAAFLPLEAGPQTWAEQLLGLATMADRAAGGDAVAATGFDIGRVAAQIRGTWME